MITRRMDVRVGDITRLYVDAIVNAANRSLLGGGGVDGAIHRAAGPQLLSACMGLGGCNTGEAKVTPGFQLPASYVIHAVGPVWRGGDKGEPEQLASCYRESLALAEQLLLRSVAFPAISTGAYGFPAEEAARIAVEVVGEFLAAHALPELVIFCAFDEANETALRQALADELHLLSKRKV